MTVTAVRKDPDTLTMTLTAEFDASPELVWDLWADPRKLERWWGPPTYPATFTAHDLAPGSRVEYHMTVPAATSRTATGTSSRSILRVAWCSSMASPTRTARRTTTSRATRDA